MLIGPQIEMEGMALAFQGTSPFSCFQLDYKFLIKPE